jgi:ankyrin repeat protein
VNGHLEVVRELVKAGGEALLNKTCTDGDSCLHAASQNGHLPVVKALVKAGGEALLNKTKANGASCLYVASRKGHLEVVRELVKAGDEALLNKTRADGLTCLHIASFQGHMPVQPVVQYLAGLLGGRLLRQASDDEGTALDCAVAGGHAGVHDWLLAAGASPHIQ